MDGINELIREAVALLAEAQRRARWHASAGLAAPGGDENPGGGRTEAATSDPVGVAVAHDPERAHARLRQLQVDLHHLVTRVLPALVEAVGPAQALEGVSGYRAPELSVVPGGRPDVAEALAAQRRRLARGQGYGAA